MVDGAGPAWAGRRKTQATEYVRRLGASQGLPCCICDQPINYDLRYPHPQSVSVQHIKSQKLFPRLRWVRSNWAPAHLDCNKAQGQRPVGGLGLMS